MLCVFLNPPTNFLSCLFRAFAYVSGGRKLEPHTSWYSRLPSQQVVKSRGTDVPSSQRARNRGQWFLSAMVSRKLNLAGPWSRDGWDYNKQTLNDQKHDKRTLWCLQFLHDCCYFFTQNCFIKNEVYKPISYILISIMFLFSFSYLIFLCCLLLLINKETSINKIYLFHSVFYWAALWKK